MEAWIKTNDGDICLPIEEDDTLELEVLKMITEDDMVLGLKFQ